MTLRTNSALAEFISIGNPTKYIASLGKTPYQWQEEVLDPRNKRILLLAARQSGKSLIVAGLAVHKAKTKRKALIEIIAPTESQAIETALKVKDFIAEDPELKTRRSNDKMIVLSNGSRIVNVVATENGPRSYSAPDLIILDEASRIPDDVYASVRPQLTTNPNATLIILSTPFGKQGFFWRAWSSISGRWKKIRVEVPYEVESTVDGLEIIDKKMTEEELKEAWAIKGVSAYFSPHHRKAFLEEELEELGLWMWGQEYGLEFVDSVENLFDTEDLAASLSDVVTPLFTDSMDEYLSDIEAI